MRSLDGDAILPSPLMIGCQVKIWLLHAPIGQNFNYQLARKTRKVALISRVNNKNRINDLGGVRSCKERESNVIDLLWFSLILMERRRSASDKNISSGRICVPSLKRVRHSISRHRHCHPQTEAIIIQNSLNEGALLARDKDVNFVRLLNSSPPPCRVISSRSKVAISPLSQFTYDYREQAYMNSEGCTWTPAYLKYCQPLITEQTNGNNENKQFSDTNKNVRITNLKRPNKEVSIQLFSLLTGEPGLTNAPFWRKGKLGKIVANCRPTSYSKFMESPYMRRRKYCF